MPRKISRRLLLALLVAISSLQVRLAVIPSSLTSSTSTKLPASLTQPNAVLVAVGGYNGREAISDVETYSLTKNSPLGNGTSAPRAARDFASVMVDNIIYIIGGQDDEGNTKNTFWSYDVLGDAWNTDLALPPSGARYGGAAVELDGTIYVLGGVLKSGSETNQVYSYSLKSRQWKVLPNVLPFSATDAYPCAVARGKSLFYMPKGALYRSDDGAKTWKNMSAPNVARTEAACAVVGDAIVLIGGTTYYIGINTTEIYNVTTDRWTTASQAILPRGGTMAVVVPNTNNVLVCGGYAYTSFEVKADCEEYDWKKNKWTTSDFNLAEARSQFGLFVTQPGV